MKSFDEIAAEIVIDPGPLNKEYRVLIAAALREQYAAGWRAGAAAMRKMIRAKWDNMEDDEWIDWLRTEPIPELPTEPDHAR